MKLCNTGWTDEARAASLAVRRAKALRRQGYEGQAARRAREESRRAMFESQRRMAGRYFAGNWYPRGKDGRQTNPYIGETGPDAPYGYVEGTKEPRKEPLYDSYGRPIIPRPKEERFRQPSLFGRGLDDNLEKDLEWLEKVHAAEKLWGRFGKKKRWMDQNPQATDADWEKYDRAQRQKWIRERKGER